MEQVQSSAFVTVTSASQPQLNVNVVTQNNGAQHATQTFALSADSYEEVFKEITKKLYEDSQGFAELIDASGNIQQANIIYDTDAFRTDLGTQGVAFLAAPNGTLPPGTILLQRKLCQDKDGRLWSLEGEQVALVPEQQAVQTTTPTSTAHTTVSGIPEERWYESEEGLSWTTSRIARYNPLQKVFKCVDCEAIGFLSRIAEHWLGNHASLRVFQCPRCPYTSAWARCVRMHLTRQHAETVTDNSMWKENPVLEEVTKYLATLKSTVEARSNATITTTTVVDEGQDTERRYICPYCPYTTDRRDLYNRHENIHREEKPFQCYVCDKQFNRADHVKKHFTRMHRDHQYDINKIKKHYLSKHSQGVVSYSKAKQQQLHKRQQAALNASSQLANQVDGSTTVSTDAISVQIAGTGQTVTIPHIAYFNPPSTPGQSGPLQGIPGVGGTKKESKGKGKVKKKVGEKMFTCSYCPWQGVDNWCLKRHLNTHIKPFLCALCDYKAARSERLATHVLKVHNKRVCHKCSFLADDTDSLSHHIQDAHQNPLVKTGFNCNVCQEYFELRADLEAHAILEHQKVIVQCDLCDFRTTDELSMEAHLREKHNLQPGMGAVAAAAAAAQSMANSGTSTFQMQLPTQSQLHLPDPLNLDGQSLLLNANGESLGQSSVAATASAVSESMSPITFQQDASGAIVPKLEQGLMVHQQLTPDGNSSNLVDVHQDGTGVGTSAAGSSLAEAEPETLCEKCGIEFADEASLKLHERRHWTEESNDKEQAQKKKSIVRSYVCSTCSYTAVTRNLMMQHQRAHNGLELVCKADGCMFSTPFENTLKEHILAEHALEPNARCPHCGLKIPTLNAFTYHWRHHHKGLCGLCVNLYRIKFGVKEIGLQEAISKSMLQLLNDDAVAEVKPKIVTVSQDSTSESLPLDSTVVEESMEEMVNHQGLVNGNQVSATKLDVTEEQELDRRVDDIVQIHNNNNNNNNTVNILSQDDTDGEPPMKKAKLDLDFSPVVQAVQKFRTRECYRILPPLTEIVVSPVFSHNQLPFKKPTCIPHRAFHCASKWSSRSSLSWYIRCSRLRRTTKRCHHPECFERQNTCYFPSRRSIILHQIRRHFGPPSHECDTCSLKFKHFYQAYLHKLKNHPDEHARDLHIVLNQDKYESSTTVGDFNLDVSDSDVVFQEESQSHPIDNVNVSSSISNHTSELP